MTRLRGLNFPKWIVHSCDTSTLEQLVDTCAKNPELARQVQGSFMLLFEEFERPNQSVFLEPEVKAFLKKAHQRIPYLWYFLDPNPKYGNMLMFLAVHASPDNIIVTGENVYIMGYAKDDRDLLTSFTNCMIATAEFSDRMADDTKSIISSISAHMSDETLLQVLHIVCRIES